MRRNLVTGMKHALILAACLCTPCVAQDLPDADPAVQEQIEKTYAAFGRHKFEPHAEGFQELEKLQLADKDELVRQLAIFAATPGEEQRPLAANVILGYLRIPPTVTIRVLAPYLDSNDPKLRAFVHDYFLGIVDSCESVNQTYLEYVRWIKNHGEEVPAPFIRYIYERSPGQALLTFRIATVDHSPYLKLLNKSIGAAPQGRTPTPEERQEISRVQKAREREGRTRREILLAEHTVSNALWLHKNGFKEQFHAVLPQAMAELEKLASHEEWWARLYVVYVMRQNPVLLQDHILRKLAEDENPLVSEAAKG